METAVGTEENEGLIAQALEDAEKIQLNSDLREHPVLHRGDGELDAPVTVREIKGADYRRIWNRVTGEPIPVLYYMIPQKLRQREKNGQLQFTAVKPNITWRAGGVLKCPLHPDSPDRKHYNELGLRTCTKSNILNAYEVTQHMAFKHKKEWAAIQDEKKERERQEDRQLQRMLLKSQLPTRKVKTKKTK